MAYLEMSRNQRNCSMMIMKFVYIKNYFLSIILKHTVIVKNSILLYILQLYKIITLYIQNLSVYCWLSLKTEILEMSSDKKTILLMKREPNLDLNFTFLFYLFILPNLLFPNFTQLPTKHTHEH